MENIKEDIILEAVDLKYSYEDSEKYALNGLNVKLKRGKRVCFMGANGSGKSTLFLLFNGVLQPKSGKIILDGKDVEYSKKGLRDLRSKVGIVFQDPDNQLFSASVRQEISFGLFNLGMKEEQVREEVENIMEELEIKHFSEKPTYALSGGQKKQVSIADVMVMKPEIIILDEPAAALDPKHTIIVERIVEKMVEEGITVIISTHDVDFAMNWAEEIVVVHKGEIAAHGNPEEVLSNEELLRMTNLKKPACLELFQKLVERGIIEKDKKTPKNLQELESYIE